MFDFLNLEEMANCKDPVELQELLDNAENALSAYHNSLLVRL